jgi:ribosomal protein S18 acetylase RimI-like enzyme
MINKLKFEFKPINLEKDTPIILEFLKDAKELGGDKLDEKDSQAYIKAIQNRQKRDPNFCVLLYENSKPIGLVDAYPMEKYPDIGFVCFYYLISEFRGKGHGRILENHSMMIFKKYKCTKAYLDVSKKNINAIKFYKKNGWIINSEKENHFSMKKNLEL